MSAPGAQIRRYQPGDRDALYRVCLLTGNAGNDASDMFEDPRQLGHVYVGPYLALEPELAFVLQDGLGVCGYVLGARDTTTFFRNWHTVWLPPLAATYPDPAGEREHWTPTDWLGHNLHHPGVASQIDLERYPSHLHIDLLPRAQGQGHGTRMLARLLAELAGAGSPGVYLCADSRNLRALAFYRKRGFAELIEVPGATYLGKRL